MTLFPDEATPSAERRRPRPGRRAAWILLVVAAICGLVLALTPSPYVIARPGPAFNTLGDSHKVGSEQDGGTPLITITGHPSHPADGALDMLTVSTYGVPGNLPSWLEVARAWFEPSEAVLPVQAVFPPGVTVEDFEQGASRRMSGSQQNAIAAALGRLGIPYERHEVTVVQVQEGAPADGRLRVGDVVESVDGRHVGSISALQRAITAHGTDAPATLGVLRDGRQRDVSVTPERRDGDVVVGVVVGPGYTFPFDVEIHLENVGGPSAGMMFALGILDKLTPGDLTGGRKIAGTGTITADGEVGRIGDIRQKMYGARAAGASWFLAPADNCDEVVGHVPSGLTVFSVHTLGDALTAVKTIARGGPTGSLATCRSAG